MFTSSEVIVLTNTQTDAAEKNPTLFATGTLRRWIIKELTAETVERGAYLREILEGG